MDFDTAVAELETLVQTLEREGDERALVLLQLIDAIHRPALELIAAGELEDPIARALLAMYDLAPVEDHVLVEEALDTVRPYIHSHGGEIEVLSVADGVVHVRMSGSCHGCAASALTLRRGIESALRDHYPGFREVVAHEPEDAPAGPLLQIEDLRRPVFVGAGAADEVTPGSMKGAEVDGVSVLLVNAGGEIYGFRNACPVDELPLDGGRLADTVIVCPWHNCAYDARSGKRLDEPGQPGLAVIPVAIRDGVVQTAVNVA
jgi:nitrite reductase/ring-hydroxylating ferredoxin subunit/Fe-S cluster biogenesis protein NfuA